MYPFNLEAELCKSSRILALVIDDDFAGELYAALCNTQWRKRLAESNSTEDAVVRVLKGGQNYWSASWRTAGDIVATLRNMTSTDIALENYLDWYCHGHEGNVSLRVAEITKQLGWEYSEYD